MKDTYFLRINLAVAIILLFTLYPAFGETQEDLDYNHLRCLFLEKKYKPFADELRKFKKKYPESQYLPHIVACLQDFIHNIYDLDEDNNTDLTKGSEKIQRPAASETVLQVLTKYFHILFSRNATFLIDNSILEMLRKTYDLEKKSFLIYQSNGSIMIFDLKKNHGFLIPRDEVLYIDVESLP